MYHYYEPRFSVDQLHNMYKETGEKFVGFIHTQNSNKETVKVSDLITEIRRMYKEIAVYKERDQKTAVG